MFHDGERKDRKSLEDIQLAVKDIPRTFKDTIVMPAEMAEEWKRSRQQIAKRTKQEGSVSTILSLGPKRFQTHVICN